MHWVQRDPRRESVSLPFSPRERLSHLRRKIIVVSDDGTAVVWLAVGARVTPVIATVRSACFCPTKRVEELMLKIYARLPLREEVFGRYVDDPAEGHRDMGE